MFRSMMNLGMNNSCIRPRCVRTAAAGTDDPCAMSWPSGGALQAPGNRWLRSLVAGGLPLAQPEALDLPGRRLRQLVDELDEARVLVGRQAVLHEGLQLLFGGGPAALQHDEGLGPGEPVAVLRADHGGLEHG